jgi:hypothetical protein
LSTLLGIRWNRFFDAADPQDRANDVMRRFSVGFADNRPPNS